jgi:hypothetical protein
MGKLIRFPNIKQPTPIQSESDRLQNIRAYQSRFILDKSIELAYDTLDEIEKNGIDLRTNPEIETDLLMVCEAIKSTMARACNLTHPLHDLADQIINKQHAADFRNGYLEHSEQDELT